MDIQNRSAIWVGAISGIVGFLATFMVAHTRLINKADKEGKKHDGLVWKAMLYALVGGIVTGFIFACVHLVLIYLHRSTKKTKEHHIDTLDVVGTGEDLA